MWKRSSIVLVLLLLEVWVGSGQKVTDFAPNSTPAKKTQFIGDSETWLVSSMSENITAAGKAYNSSQTDQDQTTDQNTTAPETPMPLLDPTEQAESLVDQPTVANFTLQDGAQKMGPTSTMPFLDQIGQALVDPPMVANFTVDVAEKIGPKTGEQFLDQKEQALVDPALANFTVDVAEQIGPKTGEQFPECGMPAAFEFLMHGPIWENSCRGITRAANNTAAERPALETGMFSVEDNKHARNNTAVQAWRARIIGAMLMFKDFHKVPPIFESLVYRPNNTDHFNDGLTPGMPEPDMIIKLNSGKNVTLQRWCEQFAWEKGTYSMANSNHRTNMIPILDSYHYLFAYNQRMSREVLNNNCAFLGTTLWWRDLTNDVMFVCYVTIVTMLQMLGIMLLFILPPQPPQPRQNRYAVGYNAPRCPVRMVYNPRNGIMPDLAGTFDGLSVLSDDYPASGQTTKGTGSGTGMKAVKDKQGESVNPGTPAGKCDLIWKKSPSPSAGRKSLGLAKAPMPVPEEVIFGSRFSLLSGLEEDGKKKRRRRSKGRKE